VTFFLPVGEMKPSRNFIQAAETLRGFLFSAR